MRGLYGLKPWFSARLRTVLTTAVRRGWSPDAVTYVGIGFAAAAGGAIAAGWWLVALPLLIVRLGCANLDGALARARGITSTWGSVLNEIGDRASDLLVFAGLALLTSSRFGWLSWPELVVLVAALTATLPTFASLAVAAAGGPRANGGPLGKVERSLLAVVATAWPNLIWIVSAVVIAGSLGTCVARLKAGHRELTQAAP